MKSDYEDKKAARIERYENSAAKAKKESASAYNRAGEIGSYIPFGQPIMIGHHSEKRHRRDIEKIDNAMRKSCELRDKASYYEDRAEAAESNTAISSDNPDAVSELEFKLGGLVKKQEFMKKVNKVIRKWQKSEQKNSLIDALVKSEIRNTLAVEIVKPNCYGTIGFETYQLSNNNAMIRTTKKRLELLIAHENDKTTEKEFTGGKLVDSVEDNRLQFDFDEKPSEEIRKALKANGFKWAPSVGFWQRFRSRQANWCADDIIKKHYSQGGE